MNQLLRDEMERRGPAEEQACVFLCTTTETQEMINLVDVMHQMFKEAPFRVTAQGIQVQTIDPTNSCMTRIVLESMGFASFYMDYQQGMFEFGMSIETLRNTLRQTTNHDSFTMYILKQLPQVLFVCTYRESQNTTCKHCFPLLRQRYTELAIDEVDFTHRIQMDSRNFYSMIKLMANAQGVNLYLAIKEGAMFISSNGDFSATSLHMSAEAPAAPAPECERPERGEPAVGGEAAEGGGAAEGGDPAEGDRKRRRTTPRTTAPVKKRPTFTILKQGATLNSSGSAIQLDDTGVTSFPLSFVERLSKAHILSPVFDLYFRPGGLLVAKYVVGRLGVVTYMLSPSETADVPLRRPPRSAIVDEAGLVPEEAAPGSESEGTGSEPGTPAAVPVCASDTDEGGPDA